ncbi:hypothetical protein HHI36_014379 [Cryptolaemus montrouzieri]|uniref:Uncharacterized protein n=1 Tax=Cryptolaemus montrouzieri TaxID=559131 RepID=A0ABD2N2N0_9CUCU
MNKNHERENTQEVKYNLERLMHDSVRCIYQKRLDEKLIEEQSLPLQERYQHIIDSIHKASGVALGERKKKKSIKIWCTEEIEQEENKNL